MMNNKEKQIIFCKNQIVDLTRFGGTGKVISKNVNLDGYYSLSGENDLCNNLIGRSDKINDITHYILENGYVGLYLADSTVWFVTAEQKNNLLNK